MTDLAVLIAPEELAQAASPGGTWPYDVGDDAVAGEMRASMRHAQQAVASRLGYHPLVHAARQAGRPFLSPTPVGPFVASGALAVGYVYATARPVVEVFTADVELDGGLRLAYSGTYPAAGLSYAAGWRGAHHVLGGGGDFDLATLPGLSALTVLPDEMPGDVRSVLVEVALIEFDKRRLNLLGGKRNTVTIGEGQYASEGYREDAEAEALRRLNSMHRIITV